MTGQIIKRGKDRWLVRVPRGKNASGKRLYHNRTIHGPKKAAQEYLTKTLRELHTNTFVEPSNQSVAELLDNWLEKTAKQRVRPRTLGDYRWLADRYLPSIRPYDLRHTSTTLLLAAGENVKVVSERLSHASAALTLDVYSHVLPHMQHEAAERIESMIGGLR